MEYPNSSFFSLMWLAENIYLDIENCLSGIDLLLKSVPEFLSTQWDNSSGCKTQTSDSLEVHRRRDGGPIRNKRYSELEKLNISDINLVMSRLGVGYVMEDADQDEDNIFFVGDDFSTLFDEQEPSLEEIKEAFEVFDSNKDGFIDSGELARVLCDLGFRQGFDLEDCMRMIRDFDVNGDGLIDFREFVIFMEKCF